MAPGTDPSKSGGGGGSGGGSVKVLAADSPSYISSKSANSLISFSRPTRIQAVTLFYLNKILDEILLQILSSAKSLATDRIKSDGIVRVLGGASGSGSGAGALLAKNAVLEAEMELRSYTEGLRKEGGKVPLGLSATSRLDGTDNFPVKSAYDLLRIRCQYYSTLGDLEDPSPNSPPDQNIMSRDGRPIATITPGVAIYVTALLEFVADYILQNVGRVIERDNSDEASLSDLRKAVEEDEATSYVWARLDTRQDILVREKEEKQRGGGSRVGRPWKVPDESELDEAAGRKHFSRHSLTTSASAHMAAAIRAGNVSSNSSSGHADGRPGQQRPMSSSGGGGGGGGAPTFGHGTDSSIRDGSGMTSPVSPSVPGSASGHTAMTSMSSSSDMGPNRRQSADKAWGGILAGRRRGSFRKSQDMNGTGGLVPPQRPVIQTGPTSPVEDVFAPDDDFDALVMSGETMKVSLTPNRLRSMEGQNDDDVDAKKNARRRPGALMAVTGLRDGDDGAAPQQPSPSASRANGSVDSFQERNSTSNPPRSLSRAGSTSLRPSSSQKNMNKMGGAPPPSSYRGPDTPPVKSPTRSQSVSGDIPAPEEDEPQPFSSNSGGQKMRARDAARSSQSVRDMVEMFNATPPSPISTGQFPSSGRDSRMSQRSISSLENGRKSALSAAGGRVRNLFSVGRKASSSNTPTASPMPPHQPLQRAQDPSWSSVHNEPVVEGLTSDDNMSSSHDHAYSASHSSTHERPSTGMVAGAALGASAALSAAAAAGRHAVNRSDSDRRSVNRSQQGHNEADERALDLTNDGGSVRSSFDGARAPTSNENVQTDALAGRSSLSAASQPGTPAHSGLVGGYEDARDVPEAQRPTSSNGHSRAEPPSRKIAWSYARPGGNKRMSGPPGTLRLRSGSGSASHGSDSHAPPSAWTTTSASLPGHGSANQTQSNDSTENLGVRTPTPAQSFFPAISPRSSTPADAERRSSKSDTARVLVQLDRRLKGATTVEECRRMVQHALAIAAAAVHDEDRPDSAPVAGSQVNGSAPVGDIPDEDEQSVSQAMQQQAISRPSTRGNASVEGLSSAANPHLSSAAKLEKMVSTSDDTEPAAFRGHAVVLPMASGYDAALDQTTPLYRHHGLVAAWLLDGESWEEHQNETVAQIPPPQLESPDDQAAASPRLSLDEYESADERGDSPRVTQDDAFENTANQSTLGLPNAKLSPRRSNKQLPGAFSAIRVASAGLNNNGHVVDERRVSAVESVKSSSQYKDAMEETAIE